ncbi:hypothetical protein [Bradyrhizobium oligotrophicum]|uniref:hypothetical protein n=1 Tax=Bradyrhizobium oligotrophicum TaxID=44255 RepID=UPI003EBBC63C
MADQIGRLRYSRYSEGEQRGSEPAIYFLQGHALRKAASVRVGVSKVNGGAHSANVIFVLSADMAHDCADRGAREAGKVSAGLPMASWCR